MRQTRLVPLTCLLLLTLATRFTLAQAPTPDAVKTQIEKLKPLERMNGNWRGTAWYAGPGGRKTELTQTERVGSLLGGAIKVVEGRGYNAAGETTFNAVGVIAYDTQQEKLIMKSYTAGRMGEFEIKVTEDGFQWEIPAGPAKIRYTAKLTDDTWTEFGERVVGDQPPFRFFEMTVKKLGDSNWPAANPVPPK